ncbi:MAG: hypothetical protein IT566_16645 [Rhodospirillaceae bacterium]|nr:hypothetical protein [Rhodospirillaceae bacterium]
MTLIYLAELTVYDGGLETLRYADGEGYNHSTAPAHYAGRLAGAPTFFAEVSADPRQAGPISSVGALTLKNADRGLTATFLTKNVAGHPVTIKIGDSAADYSTFQTVLVAIMLEPQIGPTEILIPLRDRSIDLEVLMGRTAFAGNNSTLDGVEGNTDDVKGQYKPVCYGQVHMAQPPFVNTSRPIAQIHDGVIEDIDAGYDKGVALTKGTAVTFATLTSTSDPAAGRFRYHLGAAGVTAAYTRLVSSEARSGPIFYTIKGDKRGGTYRTSAADLFKEWAEQRVTSGPSIVAADITALNTASSAVNGYWNGDGLTVAEAINLLLTGVHAKWWIDATGQLRVRQITAPSGTPAVTFRRFGVATAAIATDVDIVDFEPLAPEQPRIWRAAVLYKKFWHTQVDGLDANVTQDIRASIVNEFRRTDPEEDTAIRTAVPAAQELEVQTLLNALADAETLRDLLFAIFSVRRDTLKLTVRCDAATAAALDIGVQAKTYDIMDYGSIGRSQVVLGRGLYDRKSRLMQIKVFG